MQTQRTAAAQEQATGLRRRNASAPPGGASEGARRRLGMTGPGERRVPSLMALKGAARHSRIVRTMRVILPALALLVIGLVALQAFMYKADDTLKLKYAEPGTSANDLRMVSPELSFPFGKDSWFRATAGSAKLMAPHQVKLDGIQADFGGGKDGWASLTASDGLVDIKKKQITLGGGLSFFSSYGYELRTEAAVFDTGTGTVSSKAEVTGQGPLGTLRCDGFSASGKGIRCEGNVRMTFARPAPPSG